MAIATVVDRELVDKAVALHGELCPGLATGIQIARLALDRVGGNAAGHRVVAVAETDICAVDAVQAILGCTVGNRNLVMLDHGKVAFQFFTEGKAIRISGRHPWSSEYQAARQRVLGGHAAPDEVTAFRALHEDEVTRILSTSPEELFSLAAVDAAGPLASTVDPWLTCQECGEEVMESRTRHLGGRQICIPCYHRATGRS